jgi:hypothetical protein
MFRAMGPWRGAVFRLAATASADVFSRAQRIVQCCAAEPGIVPVCGDLESATWR